MKHFPPPKRGGFNNLLPNDKESLRNNEKHCGSDTLRLRRMEYVLGNEAINVVLG